MVSGSEAERGELYPRRTGEAGSKSQHPYGRPLRALAIPAQSEPLEWKSRDYSAGKDEEVA
jgi:hypothetical protein